MSIEVTNIDRMSKEIASSAAILSSNEARYLVDAYYIMQEDRKRTNNQVRAVTGNADEQHAVSENKVTLTGGALSTVTPIQDRPKSVQ